MSAPVIDESLCPLCIDKLPNAIFLCCKKNVCYGCLFKFIQQTPRVCPYCRQDPFEKIVKAKNEAVVSYLSSTIRIPITCQTTAREIMTEFDKIQNFGIMNKIDNPDSEYADYRLVYRDRIMELDKTLTDYWYAGGEAKIKLIMLRPDPYKENEGDVAKN